MVVRNRSILCNKSCCDKVREKVDSSIGPEKSASDWKQLNMTKKLTEKI